MAADMSDEVQRKRRAHKKSRKGCRNCKLRRVKCDEKRPSCFKCRDYGYICNYDSRTPDLEMAISGGSIAAETGEEIQSWSTFSSKPLKKPTIPITLEPSITIGDGMSSMILDRQSLARLDRFRNRTVLSIGTPTTSELFQNISYSMAFEHPYLMHVMQTLTATHDRFLALPSPHSYHRSVTESYHLSHAASLFNKKLFSPINDKDRDALWATAALMGIISISSIEASTPYEAWPLTPYSDTDLDWLRMSESKVVIWNLTKPDRPDSVFHKLSIHFIKAHTESEKREPNFSVLPPQFLELCEIDTFSTASNNPYYALLVGLVNITTADNKNSATQAFLGSLSHMQSGFKGLMKSRDPRALLLVAWWYAKVHKLNWWLELRAVTECQAICIYLGRYYADDLLIKELLEFPRMECGLADR
ncbi:C6 finger domain protein [Rutstroemia sp. NJR-2017a BBW]|nr:C6 finger domain protein [Rutstroemia sp. NJR-2017a BBW]